MPATTSAPIAHRLRAAFAWRGDRGDDNPVADPTTWWRDPALLRAVGPALAALHGERRPTLVIGVESSGSLVGPLVAAALGVGFVEVRKDPAPAYDSDAWATATAPPDYRDRQLVLGVPRRLIGTGERVLLVDDWIETGGQAAGARRLVAAAGARWVGVAVVVDALASSRVRRDLEVRSLVHVRDL
jgi:adenine phosphoribosyltransferase